VAGAKWLNLLVTAAMDTLKLFVIKVVTRG